MVIPIHKRRNPLAGFFFAAEWPVWIVRPVFNSAEQRFGIGVVVAHPRAGEGSEHTQLLQPNLKCGRPDC